MISAIINFVASLLGAVFNLVGGVLRFAFSLPLWFIIVQNLLCILAIVVIVCKVIQKKTRR